MLLYGRPNCKKTRRGVLLGKHRRPEFCVNEIAHIATGKTDLVAAFEYATRENAVVEFIVRVAQDDFGPHSDLSIRRAETVCG
jgi:hypothetical protein